MKQNLDMTFVSLTLFVFGLLFLKVFLTQIGLDVVFGIFWNAFEVPKSLPWQISTEIL